MRKMSTAELCSLEVINLCGGESLGYPTGVEIDVECGNVLALTVSCRGGFTLFDKREDRIIPWRRIECIGEDAILVKMEKSEFPDCSCTRKEGRKRRFF